MTIRILTPDDIPAYVQHMVRADADSGEGGVYFGPYSRHAPFDVDAAIARARTRWTTPLSTPGWRRAWGFFHNGVLVGHAYLAGGQIPAELHRVQLGMGLQQGYRRQGAGTRLLAAAVAWAEAQPDIAWIDLGVFGNNLPAQALYRRAGFVELGRTPDRYRVDGTSIDDIAMALAVGGPTRG